VRSRFAIFLTIMSIAVVWAPATTADATSATLMHGWSTVRKTAGAKGQLCRVVFDPGTSYGLKVRVNSRHASTSVSGRYELREVGTPYPWGPWTKPGSAYRIGTGVGPDDMQIRVQLKTHSSRTRWSRWYSWGEVMPCP